jgi:hypothetical protein
MRAVRGDRGLEEAVGGGDLGESWIHRNRCLSTGYCGGGEE